MYVRNKSFETFLETICNAVVKQNKINNKFGISKRKAIQKLEGKDKDKRFFRNWRPISFLNVNLNNFKNFHIKKKKNSNTVPAIISSNQTTYVEKKIHWRLGRVISDILEIFDPLKSRFT